MTPMPSSANMSTERLDRDVRRALAEAKESFAKIATSAQFNEFVQAHVGQMTVGEDGTLCPTEAALDAARASEGSIPVLTPRARSYTRQVIQAAFWRNPPVAA